MTSIPHSWVILRFLCSVEFHGPQPATPLSGMKKTLHGNAERCSAPTRRRCPRLVRQQLRFVVAFAPAPQAALLAPFVALRGGCLAQGVEHVAFVLCPTRCSPNHRLANGRTSMFLVKTFTVRAAASRRGEKNVVTTKMCPFKVHPLTQHVRCRRRRACDPPRDWDGEHLVPIDGLR